MAEGWGELSANSGTQSRCSGPSAAGSSSRAAAGKDGAAETEGAGPRRGEMEVKQPRLRNAWCEGIAGAAGK